MSSSPDIVPSSASGRLSTPTEIHGYRVLDALGEGAASQLYVVSDPRTRELLALKHVRASRAEERRFLAQAEREHEVGSRVTHAAVRGSRRLIRYREILRTTEIAVVLDFVDGQPLDELGPLPWHDLLGVFATTAEGLAHLHELGWAHADLKPGNVLRTAPGRATIIDLGQACRLGDRKARIQGTPGFLAPEQVSLGPIDERTDAYLFGATIYRRLTGRNASSELLSGGGPRLPLSRLVATVPPRLAEIVESCLDPLPERRPSSLAVVAARIRAMASPDRARPAGSKQTA